VECFGEEELRVWVGRLPVWMMVAGFMHKCLLRLALVILRMQTLTVWRNIISDGRFG
jgi:hypothetical protein